MNFQVFVDLRLTLPKKFSDLFSLGNLSFTGKFANNIKQNIPKKEIHLVICNSCKLVQLNQDFNPKYLYGKDYGYRTGLNQTMTDHVKLIAHDAEKLSKIKKGDFVLDIASNDGTLLNFYNKEIEISSSLICPIKKGGKYSITIKDKNYSSKVFRALIKMLFAVIFLYLVLK